jgi:hypothetical protein
MVTPPIQLNKNSHSSNIIKMVTPPIQLNKNSHSSNTINFYFIALEEWQLLFNCIGGVTISIVLEEWQYIFNCIGGVYN